MKNLGFSIDLICDNNLLSVLLCFDDIKDVWCLFNNDNIIRKVSILFYYFVMNAQNPNRNLGLILKR